MNMKKKPDYPIDISMNDLLIRIETVLHLHGIIFTCTVHSRTKSIRMHTIVRIVSVCSVRFGFVSMSCPILSSCWDCSLIVSCGLQRKGKCCTYTQSLVGNSVHTDFIYFTEIPTQCTGVYEQTELTYC